MKKALYSYFFSDLFTGCVDRSYNATVIANEYCNCMTENNANKDYYNARVLCDSKFIMENRYFKISYIEALYGSVYMGTLDKKSRDSVNEFTATFTSYVSEHCSYIYNEDSIRKGYLKKMK